MDGRSTSGRPMRDRRLRLWHLAVAVLASALLLGLVRAASVVSGSLARGLFSIVGTLILLLLGASYLLAIHLGATLGRRVTRPWESWGVRKGGPVGLGVRACAEMTRLAIFAGACLLTPAVGLVSFPLLAHLLFDILVP